MVPLLSTILTKVAGVMPGPISTATSWKVSLEPLMSYMHHHNSMNFYWGRSWESKAGLLAIHMVSN